MSAPCLRIDHPEGYEYFDKQTIDVEDARPSAKVTYTGTKGKRFSVIVRQKPDPIGFHAKLPGSKCRR